MPDARTIERFMAKIEQDPDTGCWIWQACRGAHGYGRLSVDRQPQLAHRFSYEHHVGPIPDGLHIHHRCGVRACVNPEHLEAVTPQVNAVMIAARGSYVPAAKPPPLPRGRDPKIRFMENFEIDTDGCWRWTASRVTDGYGQMYVHGKVVKAHRFGYQMFRGEIPAGLVLDHLCRNRWCVNPWHLEPVTQRENIMRGVGHAATNTNKVACKRGHAFTPENTYVYADGRRMCRTCQALHNKHWKARHADTVRLRDKLAKRKARSIRRDQAA